MIFGTNERVTDGRTDRQTDVTIMQFLRERRADRLVLLSKIYSRGGGSSSSNGCGIWLAGVAGHCCCHRSCCTHSSDVMTAAGGPTARARWHCACRCRHFRIVLVAYISCAAGK